MVKMRNSKSRYRRFARSVIHDLKDWRSDGGGGGGNRRLSKTAKQFSRDEMAAKRVTHRLARLTSRGAMSTIVFHVRQTTRRLLD